MWESRAVWRCSGFDAGYKIIGLPIAGFDRKHLWKNVSVLIKLARSQWKARSIIKNFRPQVAVGVGGYASGPTLKTAGMMGVPTLIQEQNSYAGVTNKLLAQKAKTICVAYDGMEKFFPADKIIMTGNPVRQNLTKDMPEKGAALRSFNLQPDKKTILIVGGSLGARTINNTLTAALATIKENNDIQFIWQTGKYYYPQVTEALRAAGELPNLYVTDFIKDMAAAYAASDLVISRAGSRFYFRVLSVAQACGSGYSPNVAEDHQTKNALALVDKQAAIYVKDSEAEAKLMDVALNTVADDRKLKELSENIAKLALPDSARIIAQEVIKLAEAEN
ncbi:UDP-N-acetylglucosamine--N-acetylmuramyl-(pentapeptide) pyrophosphoryl-undecaprenol N-acetylglucosamine transferase [Bacteroides thetaiotaomicron]|nr:UDP-N-acetylglucosamine--N-acetylmuramyl-(pentapeptide) pyrophosphoryl-undecaprenol N-acetylglucosamine transferase [Bacteroides thetaiotaomicron]